MSFDEDDYFSKQIRAIPVRIKEERAVVKQKRTPNYFKVTWFKDTDAASKGVESVKIAEVYYDYSGKIITDLAKIS